MSREDFDQAKQELTLEEAARRCGATLAIHGSGGNVRLDCPFDCPGDHVGKRELSLNAAHADKLWQCHRYVDGEQCPVRGDIVHLVHGLLTGKLPPRRITGGDFKRAKAIIMGEAAALPMAAESPPPATSAATVEPPQRNVPLARSDDAKIRELAGMQRLLITDAEQMRPKVSQYWRERRHYLTPERCDEWGVGVRPARGEDKRGWSLRNQVVYTFWSENDQELCFVGRDPEYEDKLRTFEQVAEEEREAKKSKAPIKHRFPKTELFRRGLELYGQHRSRLTRHVEYRDFIAEYGIVVVEGFNDVLRLDSLEIPAVAICSNRITRQQVEKVIRFAQTLAKGRVSLLFDCQPSGDDGAKDVMWRLKQAEPALDVRTAWSCQMHDGEFRGLQPEQLQQEHVEQLLAVLAR